MNDTLLYVRKVWRGSFELVITHAISFCFKIGFDTATILLMRITRKHSEYTLRSFVSANTIMLPYVAGIEKQGLIFHI